ncbi:hypothetical protein HDV04_005570 [Boothiomyces sp. JEL0838]|nr:hypothetical protein HDV04_005570 [Boothiomyces sp. JEL0838]
MGIYPEHGVEYLVKPNNANYITIPSSKECEPGLIQSSYFKKYSWFKMSDIQQLVGNPKRINDQEFDWHMKALLSEAQKMKIENACKQYENSDHGWYEVASIGTSL